MLHDDVLLEIFESYVDACRIIEKWITLAHVCRRWRILVFQSPRRLNLQLVCTPSTLATNSLDIWPPLPFIILCTSDDSTSNVDSTIAALELNDRVSQIELLCLSYSRMEYVAKSAAMQKPFLELTHLDLSIDHDDGHDDGPVLPNSFLGGTAPRLRSIYLSFIQFPGLPKLLLSATHLVILDLSYITHSGYISPETMATTISALTGLESLRLQFLYSPPALESQRPPLSQLRRSILPNLTRMLFAGVSGYLEEILAWIDAPRLNKVLITLNNQFIFDTPQLFQLISRSPTLRAPEKGQIIFYSNFIIVKFPSQTSDLGELTVKIPFITSELWQFSSLELVCTSSFPPFSTLEDLYIRQVDDIYSHLRRLDDIQNMLWLQLLHPFGTVKNLYLCNKLVPCIALALEELVGSRTTEVLPTLENLFLEGFQPSRPFHEGIETFIAARRITSHPVAVSRWDNKDSEYEILHGASSDIFHL